MITLIDDNFETYASAGSPKNIERVEKDLAKSTQFVHILHLLESFLAEIVLEHKNIDMNTEIDPGYLKDIMKESKDIFKKMLREAISFCNNNKNVNREELFEHLKD